MMTNKKSIILLSGGLDSVISLSNAKEEYNIQMALTFNYGQKASQKELLASKKIAEFYNINHKIIELPWLKAITTTALVNNSIDTPKPTNTELDDFEASSNTAAKVWVPNRNGLFLNIAASFCDSFGYSNIIFGANKEEGTTFPDNTQDFIDRINESFEYSTMAKPKVVAPLISKEKKEIVEIGIQNNAPFQLIQSCYHSLDKHCGECESCKRLKRALQETGHSEIIKTLFK